VPFHQDGNERGRTVWICLDDIDSENGGLCVLPGWHKKGRMPLKMVSDPEELADAEYFASHNVYGVDVAKAERCTPPSLITVQYLSSSRIPLLSLDPKP
jgi:ectoine hydroxylase-related dioxygenase (phytanoyl-CoA dioxygenase family)